MQIKERRLQAGLTQKQLAGKMNVDQSAVSLWEAGKARPARKHQKKLAKILHCTVDELLGEK